MSTFDSDSGEKRESADAMLRALGILPTTESSGAGQNPMTSSEQTSDFNLKEVRETAKDLYGALGEPELNENPMMDGNRIGSLVHPVFLLAEHFRANDRGNRGYTANDNRGDHLSIPAYCENGDVMAIDVSFHKGDTFLTLCTFSSEPKEAHDELYKLLRRLETR